LVETGLALLAHSSLPLRFWDEAFLTACYLINRMPTPVLNQDTPIHRLLNIQPNYSFLRVFGCACWPSLRKYNTRKLEFRSKMCVFLGYSPMHKGYKCLDRSTNRIYISRDVVFDESVFPFATPGVTVDVSTLTEAISFPSTEPATSVPMRKYDLTYLSTDSPSIFSDYVLQEQVPAIVACSPDMVDVHGCRSDPPATQAASSHAVPMHATPMQATLLHDACMLTRTQHQCTLHPCLRLASPQRQLPSGRLLLDRLLTRRPVILA
jgi:hypothetical protein